MLQNLEAKEKILMRKKKKRKKKEKTSNFKPYVKKI